MVYPEEVVKIELRRLAASESGQGLVEYGVIVMLVGIACIIGLVFFGHKANNTLNNDQMTLPLG